MKIRFHPYLLALLAVFASSAALAQWVWNDAAGRKVYSDRAPPADVPAHKILKKPLGSASLSVTPAASDADTGNTAKDPAKAASAAHAAGKDAKPALTPAEKQLEEKKKQAEAEEAAKKKAEEETLAKQKAENCERAKSAKATLDQGIRIAKTNSKGERSIMDDADRVVETKRLEGIINSDCK